MDGARYRQTQPWELLGKGYGVVLAAGKGWEQPQERGSTPSTLAVVSWHSFFCWCSSPGVQHYSFEVLQLVESEMLLRC